jgi:Cys-rich four helix bundle protein (predicted Tat secretion target)
MPRHHDDRSVPSEASRPSDPGSAFGRRELLVGAGALGVLAAARSALASEGAGHEGHSSPSRYTPGVANKRHPALLAATWDCIAKGEACLSHCMETFAAGDTTMAECAASVDTMLPVCNALAHLAVRDSKHLPAIARACNDVCADCEKACREHAEHQPECKAAADACQRLQAELAKFVA